MYGHAEAVADRVCLLGCSGSDQMSLFSVISIASTTSMPR